MRTAIWTIAVAIIAALWGSASCRVRHCEILDIEGFHIGGGVAHLVYSMERKCVLCYKEVGKLLKLKSQMAKFGHQMDVSVVMNRPSSSTYRRKLPLELKVDDKQAWKILGKKNGHIFIFDKCGRMVYQVITPWSKQIYPFTGMAALSAILDDPCGRCNVTLQTNASSNLETSRETIANNHNSEEAAFYGTLRDSKIPLTIIYRSRHSHVEGNRKTDYNVVELRLNDPEYHSHAETGSIHTFEETRQRGNKVISIFEMSAPSPKGVITLCNGTLKRNGRNGKGSTHIASEVQVTENPTRPTPTIAEYDDYSDEVETSSETSEEDINTEDLMKHYQPMMKWMTCAQQIAGA